MGFEGNLPGGGSGMSRRLPEAPYPFGEAPGTTRSRTEPGGGVYSLSAEEHRQRVSSALRSFVIRRRTDPSWIRSPTRTIAPPRIEGSSENEARTSFPS
jgi:hypothetical protein